MTGKNAEGNAPDVIVFEPVLWVGVCPESSADEPPSLRGSSADRPLSRSGCCSSGPSSRLGVHRIPVRAGAGRRGTPDPRVYRGDTSLEVGRSPIEWGQRRRWPNCFGWFAPSPSPNRTCDFHRIRLSARWVRPMCVGNICFSSIVVGFIHPSSGVVRSVPLPSDCPPSPCDRLSRPRTTTKALPPRPALAAGWPTPLPESRTRFPSSRRLHLHAVLGSACTPGTARCRARHRRMPVKGVRHPCLNKAVSASRRQRFR